MDMRILSSFGVTEIKDIDPIRSNEDRENSFENLVKPHLSSTSQSQYNPKSDEENKNNLKAALLWEPVVALIVKLLTKKYDLPNPPTSDIIKFLTKAPEPEKKVIQDALYQTSTATGAVEELTSRGYEPRRAFREMVTFMLTRKSPPPKDVLLLDDNNYLWDITANDLKAILRNNPTLTAKLLQHELELKREEVKKDAVASNRVAEWIDTLDKLTLVTKSPDEIDVRKLEKPLHETQETLRKTRAVKIRTATTAIQEWTEKLSSALRTVNVEPFDKSITVSGDGLVPITIPIDAGDPLLEIATLRKHLNSIAGKLKESKPLTEAELKVANAIIDANPHLGDRLSSTLASIDRQLEKSRMALDIYKMAGFEDEMGLRKVLKIVAEHPSRPWRLVLPNGERCKVQWVDERLAIKGSPEFSFGPYRFKKYTAFAIEGTDFKPVEALIIKDAYNENMFITYEEFRKIEGLLEKAKTIKGAGGKAITGSLEGLVEDLKASWISVGGHSDLIDGSTNEIRRTGEIQRELNWARGLLYELGDIVDKVNRYCDGCFGGSEPRSLAGSPDVGNLDDINFKINWVRSKYGRFFYDMVSDQKNETVSSVEFERQLSSLKTLLENRALGIDSANSSRDISQTLSALRELSKMRMSERSFIEEEEFTRPEQRGVTTTNLFGEIKLWLKDGETIVENGELSTEQRQVISHRFPVRTTPPSLARARKLHEQGSFEKALGEYSDIILGIRTTTPERIVALLESVETAGAMQDYTKANAALAQAASLIDYEGSMSKEAKTIIKHILYDSPLSKVLNIPFDLPVKALIETKGPMAETALRTTAEEIARTLLGNEPVPYIQDRTRSLTAEATDELQDIVSEVKDNGLKRFPEDLLLKTATLTTEEFNAFIRTIPPGFENSYLSEFYKKARSVVIKYGYNIESLKGHETVRLIANEAGGSIEDTGKIPRVSRTPTGQFYIDKAVLENFKRWPWLPDVGGVLAHSAFGMMSFMGAKALVEWLTPTPTRNWESAVQGQSVMLTAMCLDSAVQNGVTHFLTKIPAQPLIAPSAPSYLNSVGSIGASMFIYRMLAGVTELAGARSSTAEWVGLAGTGVVMGGYQPLMKWISPASLTKLPFFEAVMSKMFFFYAVADMTLQAADSMVDLTNDQIDSMIRNAEYSAHKEYINNMSFFGDAPAGFFTSTYYTLESLASIVTPPALYKLEMDVRGSRWRQKTRLEYDKAVYLANYNNAVKLGAQAAEKLEQAFFSEITDNVFDRVPKDIEDLISELTTDQEIAGLFAVWQKYGEQNLKSKDQYWIFTDRVISGGNIINEKAIAYWMKPRFIQTIDKMIGLLDLIPADSRTEDARKSLKIYRNEIERLSLLYTMSLTEKIPEQLPATIKK